jgi:hypothetical protein
VWDNNLCFEKVFGGVGVLKNDFKIASIVLRETIFFQMFSSSEFEKFQNKIVHMKEKTFC